MSGIMSMLLGARTAIAVAVDEFFNRVTLLLPGNGTNGAQNNTFLDSSTNNFTITRNGNTTQGTFSPFSQTGWSNFFDGSGDYLVTASSAALGFGTGDFTIEGWFYFTGTISTYQRPWGFSDANDNIEINGSVLRVGGTNQGTLITGSTTIVANRWYHIALTRASGVYRLWLDGTQEGSSATNSWNSSSRQMGIAAYPTGVDPITGYVSNLRVLKGTSLYSASFTPSTTPLTAITNTSLLTCQSNRFIDSSSNQIAVTVNGNPSVQAFSPFAPTIPYSAATVGGSGYFDGTGDYLTVASNAAFAFGTGDFSIECWAYPEAFAAFRSYIGIRTGEVTNEWSLDSNSSNQFFFYTNTFIATSASTFSTRQWYHLCVTRVGTALRLFVNGKLEASVTHSANLTANTLGIAALPNGIQLIQGNMANVRIVKGGIPSAYSTSSTTVGAQIFTPPTAPLTGSESLTAGSVSLLLNFTNAGITDATAKNVLETVGNAQISTTQSKFGGSSMYFDGTGDYLVIPDNPRFNLGSGNFTIEMWAYRNNATNPYALFGKRNNSSADFRWITSYINTSGTVDVQLTTTGSSWTINAATTSTVAVTTWTHLAFVRNGSDFSVYVDGTKNTLSSSLSGSIFTDSNPLVIGQTGLSGSFNYPLNGYIDDFRITLGFARYTTTFTPPTAAFPLQ